MNKEQKEMWNALCALSGEEVARLFTDFHGNNLLSDEFREYLGEEGIMDEVEHLTDSELCAKEIRKSSGYPRWACEVLCDLAGLKEEFEKSRKDTYITEDSYVAITERAAEILGVEIY